QPLQNLPLHEPELHEPRAGPNGHEQGPAGDVDRRGYRGDPLAHPLGPLWDDRGFLEPLAHARALEVLPERLAQRLGQLLPAHVSILPAAIRQGTREDTNAPNRSSTSLSFGAVRITWPRSCSSIIS